MVIVDSNITALTERLLIRPLRLDDAEAINILRANPEIMKQTPRLPCDDIEKTKEWIQGCYEEANCWNFAVELLPSTSAVNSPTNSSGLIGVMGAVRIPEVGYMFHADEWGKGYATEALEAFLDLFFDYFSGGEHPRHEYAEAHTDPENVASQKVLLKCGFMFVELREKSFQNPALGLRDTLVFRKYRPGGKAGTTSTTLEPRTLE